MDIKPSLQQLVTLADKRDEVNFAFIKQILLMASGLLGILVSLHKTTASTDNTRISFALALLLLSLGILLLSIALFAQVADGRTKFLRWKEELQLRLSNDTYQPKTMLSGNPPKIYGLCEIIGYSSLLLSIICLTIYAVLIA